MILTEKEAAERWCPHSRVAGVEVQGTNRLTPHGFPDPNANCIGSGCMAWRRAGERSSQEGMFTIVAPVGFCGLAGPAK